MIDWIYKIISDFGVMTHFGNNTAISKFDLQVLRK